MLESFLKRQGKIIGTSRFVGLNLFKREQNSIPIEVNIIKCYIIRNNLVDSGNIVIVSRTYRAKVIIE